LWSPLGKKEPTNGMANAIHGLGLFIYNIFDRVQERDV